MENSQSLIDQAKQAPEADDKLRGRYYGLRNQEKFEAMYELRKKGYAWSAIHRWLSERGASHWKDKGSMHAAYYAWARRTKKME